MLFAENWCLALSGQFQQTVQYIDDPVISFLFEKTIRHLEKICIKSQILFPGKNKKIFQNVRWKFMLSTEGKKKLKLQHFKIFFSFFLEDKTFFFQDITKTCLFKYIGNFTYKNWKFSDKKLWYFSYFFSKHRLWVLVRTASARRF